MNASVRRIWYDIVRMDERVRSVFSVFSVWSVLEGGGVRMEVVKKTGRRKTQYGNREVFREVL